ncbi:unnamed protein product, partial [Pylaiella littoralis]
MAMAPVGGNGQEGMEDQLVSAAMQISSMRQETKKTKRALNLVLVENAELRKVRSENARVIEEHADWRRKAEASHAIAIQDIKKNEKEAIDTATTAYAELEKRNAETAILKVELTELRAAAAAAAVAAAAAASAAATASAADRRRVKATGARRVSLGASEAAAAAAAGAANAEAVAAGGGGGSGASAAAAAGTAAASRGEKVRYAMEDDGDDDDGGGVEGAGGKDGGESAREA